MKTGYMAITILKLNIMINLNAILKIKIMTMNYQMLLKKLICIAMKIIFIKN